MGWIIFGTSTAAAIGLIAALSNRNKIGIWASKKTASNEADKQKNEESIHVDSESLATSNAFTDTLDETFNDGRWRVKESPFTVRYTTRNRLGNIAGLTVRFDVYMNGIHVEYFEKSVANIKSGEDIEFKVGIDNSSTLVSDLIRGAGLPKKAIVSFNVDVRSYEFYIPKSNPLYKNDDVRDAVGMPRIKREKSAMEEYTSLTADLPDELKEQTDSIITNIDKMEKVVSDSPELREKVDRFTDKYIPLINDVLRVYKNSSMSEDGYDNVSRTLQNMVNGSEIFLKQLNSKGEMDSEVARTVIEQQLMADGLMDPMNKN